MEAKENGESLKKLEKLLRTRSVPSDPYIGGAAQLEQNFTVSSISESMHRAVLHGLLIPVYKDWQIGP